MKVEVNPGKIKNKKGSRLGHRMEASWRCYNKYMNVDDMVSLLRPLFAGTPGVELAYLFGSQVTGKTGPMSDVDLAVYLAFGVNPYPLQAQLTREAGVVLHDSAVDVVVLNHAPIELAFAVIAQGRMIYEESVATRLEREAKLMSLYYDYLPVLRAQREQILQGGIHERRIQWHREAFRRTQRTLDALKNSQR